MVNRQKLTEKVLRDAVPAEGRDYQIFDTDVRGFAVCIYRGGGRAFTLDYRHAGRQRRMTFARWPEWGVTAARERAKELRREIYGGGDPLATRNAMREAPRVSDLIKRYVDLHLPHLAALNAADQRSMMAKFIGPAWGNMLVTEVSSYDVELLLNKVAEGRARPAKQKPNNRARKLQGAKPTPVRANRVGEVVRKMFAYAIKWGWREDNPAMGFRRRMEAPRERYLSQQEIARLAMALDRAEDDRAAGIIRLCMLTGARVGEVRQARFEDFNLEHLSWTKPATTTKQRRVHRVPISDEAASIVRQRRLAVVSGSPWLFPGDTLGQPVQEIRRFWARVQKEARIEDVRIHDLRHTFASLLVSGGASLEMIGKLLGHSQMQTTQRYAHLMDSPLRAGVDAVASAFKPRPQLVHDADRSDAPANPLSQTAQRAGMKPLNAAGS
ncbi:tyrosine-type recombinase/integrase [Antarctobacter heliothermus]|uniref:Site-specific recombinase XerD n=1 Tax=Antarctobacter heliothermus TaxID=74033 RepID=A0A239KIE9_9RHOB|nr:site-specific integrase [Antarctobacter heliothermus]SNT18127.1 Site-specific recombinase XerD [Antarctobacter heliothermus]